MKSPEARVGDIFFGIISEISASPRVIRITIIMTFTIDAPIINRAVLSFLFMFLKILNYKS